MNLVRASEEFFFSILYFSSKRREHNCVSIESTIFLVLEFTYDRLIYYIKFVSYDKNEFKRLKYFKLFLDIFYFLNL